MKTINNLLLIIICLTVRFSAGVKRDDYSKDDNGIFSYTLRSLTVCEDPEIPGPVGCVNTFSGLDYVYQVDMPNGTRHLIWSGEVKPDSFMMPYVEQFMLGEYDIHHLNHLAKYPELVHTKIQHEAALSVFCRLLDDKIERWGFLAGLLRDEYCGLCPVPLLECKGQESYDERIKKKRRTGRFSLYNTTFWSYVETAFDDPKSMGGPAIEMDDDMIWDSAETLAFHLAPMFIAVIPITLNAYQYYNFVGSLALMLAFFFIIPLLTDQDCMIVYNCAVCLCAFAFDNKNEEMAKIVSSVVGMFFFSLAALVPDFWTKIVIMVLVFGLYLVMLKDVFLHRRPGTQASTMILFLQVYVMHAQMQWMRDNFFHRNFSYDLFEMILNTMLPTGETYLFTQNAGVLARAVAFELGTDYGRKVRWFMALMSVQIIGFFMVRVLMGSMFLFSLRYKLRIGNAFDAFMVYSCGILSPFSVLGMWFSDPRNLDGRRVMYAAVSTMMTAFEVAYAIEFAAFRVLLNCYDLFFLDGYYTYQQRFLSNDTNMLNREFVQDGSMPPYDEADLAKIARSVMIVLSPGSERGKLKRGAGLVMKDGEGQSLYTVRHVIPKRAIELGRIKGGPSKTIHNPGVINLRTADDPIVFTRLPDDVPSVALAVVNECELEQVKMLVCLCPVWGTGNVKVRIIPFFQYDGKANKFIVRSTFIEGESGSPCIGVLSDGSFVYCGAISSGHTDRTRGNIVTACVGDYVGTRDDLSSDSEHSATADYHVKPKAHVYTHAMQKLNASINELAIFIDERGEKGWYEEEDPDRPDYDDPPEDDVEVTDNEGAAKNQRRDKKKRQNKNKQYRAFREAIDPRLNAIEALASVLYDTETAEGLAEYVRAQKGRFTIPENHTMHVSPSGQPVIVTITDRHYQRLKNKGR